MKNEIQVRYLANLQKIYAGKVDYSTGSMARELAIKASDAALNGEIRLEGDAWFHALKEISGLGKSATKKQISELPE